MIREFNCYFACVDTPTHTPKVKTITILISVRLDLVYIYIYMLEMAGQRAQLLDVTHILHSRYISAV